MKNLLAIAAVLSSVVLSAPTLAQSHTKNHIWKSEYLSTLELGTKYSSFPDGIPDTHKQKLNASRQDFENLRNYCEF